jgi:hypothetical protein
MRHPRQQEWNRFRADGMNGRNRIFRRAIVFFNSPDFVHQALSGFP